MQDQPRAGVGELIGNAPRLPTQGGPAQHRVARALDQLPFPTLGVEPCLEAQVLRVHLRSYLLERQQAHYKGVGLDRIAHRTPVDKGALSVTDDAENLQSCEPSPHVVVGLMPVLLKVDECRRDPDYLVLQRQAVQAGR